MFKKIYSLLAAFLLMASGVSAQSLTMSVKETEVAKQWKVTVFLGNSTETNLTAFDFSLQTPDGLECVLDSLTPGTRVASHALMAALQSDGKMRFVGVSPTNAKLDGTSGALFSLTLRAESYLPVGSYVLYLSNNMLARRDGTEFDVPKAAQPFKVTDLPTGIAAAPTTSSDAKAFTIDGRRVSQPGQGVYIVNGKKTLIK